MDLHRRRSYPLAAGHVHISDNEQVVDTSLDDLTIRNANCVMGIQHPWLSHGNSHPKGLPSGQDVHVLLG